MFYPQAGVFDVSVFEHCRVGCRCGGGGNWGPVSRCVDAGEDSREFLQLACPFPSPFLLVY